MSRAGTRVLAIDQGTTGTTALLVDENGAVTARGYAELPQHFPKPGWVEHQGEEIWETVLRAIETALAREAGADDLTSRASAASKVAAIGVTNQRETSIIWERATSRPIAPAIVWQDRRTAGRCEALKRAGKERAIAKATGLRLDPYFAATKVEWMLDHVSGARALARRGGLAFGTIDTWLLWKLTAGRAHVTDVTNASRTLLFDIRGRRWDEDLAALFRIPLSLLPEPLPSVALFGRTRSVPGLPDGIPIRGVAGDQQAALFGQGCVAAGGLKNTYGTGCFLMLHTGERAVASRAGLLTTLACGPVGEPAYALEGSVFIAGAAIQWLRDGLGILTSAAESESLAGSVPDAGGTYLVPAFVGLGAPHWVPEARGIWCGLTRGTTRAHLARAALESIAFQTADVVDAMRRDATAPIRRLRVDGGATANDLLMQLQSDILGIPIERPGQVESTALGAAHLAGIGAGIWERGGAIPSPEGTIQQFQPKIGHAERERRLSGWRQAVAMLLPARRGARARRSSPR